MTEHVPAATDRTASASEQQLRLFDSLCLEFVDAWNRKADPQIEDFLSRVEPELQPALFRELLLEELELRGQESPRTELEEYESRFPRFRSVIREMSEGPIGATEFRCAPPENSPRPQLPIGTVLGRYRIDGAVASGGMGDVYRATDLVLNREVAVKVLPERFSRNPERLERFQREARLLAQLAHPSIVVLHDIGQQGELAWVVMELLEGETLRQRLQRGANDVPEALRMARDVVDGLAAAHSQGIVHRDIKPENLFLTASGQVKILDFGLARATASSAPGDPPALAERRTSEGAILGTVGYMSPEQICGLPAGPASDVFSFGCVLYEMLGGVHPFRHPHAAAIQVSVMNADPPPPHELRPEVPRALSDVVMRCLRKNPEERYLDGRALREALTSMFRHGTGRGPISRPGSRRRAIYGGLVLIVSVLLVWLGVSWWGHDDASRETSFADNPTAEEDGISLAVLPFVVLSGSEETEILGEGMTISLLDQLARIPGLQVRPYAAVARPEVQAGDPAAAGRLLQVTRVLTGTVRQIDDALQIHVELVDAATNTIVWTETFRTSMAELLTAQNDLARRAVRVLRPAPAEVSSEQSAAGLPTRSLDAYRHYVMGRLEWTRRDAQSLRRALDHFRAATELDDQYAAAFAGQADCLINLAERGLMPPQDALPAVMAAASRAIALDSQLAGGHITLAMALFEFAWEFSAAEQSFLRGLQLDADHATGRQWYAEYLSAMGRHDEALAQIRLARQCDPGSPIIATIEGVILYKARRFEDAIAVFEETLDRWPDFGRVRGYLIDALLQQERFEEALQQWDFLLARDPALAPALRDAWRREGARGYWRKRLELDAEIQRHYPLSAVFTAGLHAQLGEVDTALEVLEEAARRRDPALAANLLVNPIFDPLRDHPRFRQLAEFPTLADRPSSR